MQSINQSINQFEVAIEGSSHKTKNLQSPSYIPNEIHRHSDALVSFGWEYELFRGQSHGTHVVHNIKCCALQESV